MGELLTQQPLFKGENFVDQLDKICSAIGTPSPNMAHITYESEGSPAKDGHEAKGAVLVAARPQRR